MSQQSGGGFSQQSDIIYYWMTNTFKCFHNHLLDVQ